MNDASQFSQIETRDPSLRVILLGASNLSLCFSNVIATARALFAQPIDFHVAMGFGRSYGQESKFFGKKFSGILQSDLWRALECAPRVQTVAIVADVGNDLAYEAPVEVVTQWVRETLDRLAAHDAKTSLNNVPLEALVGVGALRYRVMKTLLFPRSALTRDVMRERAEALSANLDELARERKIPVFSGDSTWYGFDPIHPRRRARGAIWQRLLGALAGHDASPTWAAATRDDARRLRALNAQFWSRELVSNGSSAPAARLADGSTITLY
jgi:hypothetical protein